MKRECLLSAAYTSGPMTFDGVEIAYSALANEMLREFKTAFFCGNGPGDQSQYHGLCEGLLVMLLLAQGNYKYLHELRSMPRPQRHAIVLTFAIDHEAEILRLQPEIVTRVESAIASSVESVDLGKSQVPAPDSSP